MSEWISGWMKEWVNECVNEWVSEWSELMSEWMKEWVNEWKNEWVSEWMNEWMNEWTASSVSPDFVENLRDEANFFTSFQIQNSLAIRIFMVDAVSESPLNKSRMYQPLLWRRHDTPKRRDIYQTAWCHITQHGNHKYWVGISSCRRFPNFSL
jgi:hypothetical protein